jgi:hypothetical protein
MVARASEDQIARKTLRQSVKELEPMASQDIYDDTLGTLLLKMRRSGIKRGDIQP